MGLSLKRTKINSKWVKILLIESLQQLDKTLQRDVDDIYIIEKIYRKVDTAVNFGGEIVFFLKGWQVTRIGHLILLKNRYN